MSQSLSKATTETSKFIESHAVKQVLSIITVIKILGKSEQGVKGNLSMLYIVMQDNYLSLVKNWNVEQTQWYTLEVFNDKQLNK